MKTEILHADADAIAKAITLLKSENLVAVPTETVYGLAGNALATAAVKKIFEAKHRPAHDPLIIHINVKEKWESLVQKNILHAVILKPTILPTLLKLTQNRWPGPLTIILPKGSAVPSETTSGQSNVALRKPAHSIFQELLGKLPFPLAAPSANQFGKTSPTTAQHVFDELHDRIPLILDAGACKIGVESTVLRLIIENDSISYVEYLRPGFYGLNEIQKSIPEISVVAGSKKSSASPGLLDHHYAPKTKLYVYSGSFSEPNFSVGLWTQWLSENFPIREARVGVISIFNPAFLVRDFFSQSLHVTLSTQGSIDEAAARLFEVLRMLDQQNLGAIICDIPTLTQHPLEIAISDRLFRAAFKK